MRYFTLSELTRSNAAARLKIDNTPTSEAVSNLNLLVTHILDPLRQAYGKPIIVNSGYRAPLVNRAIGGVRNSQHCTGQAADITTGTRDGNRQLFQLIQSLNLPFDQLINESRFLWVHVSYSPRHRRSVLHL